MLLPHYVLFTAMDDSDDEPLVVRRQRQVQLESPAPAALAKPAQPAQAAAPKPSAPKPAQPSKPKPGPPSASAKTTGKRKAEAPAANGHGGDAEQDRKKPRRAAADKHKPSASPAATRGTPKKADKAEIKWTTLEHAGVMFPPEYVPHGVKMLYNGAPVDLEPHQACRAVHIPIHVLPMQ